MGRDSARPNRLMRRSANSSSDLLGSSSSLSSMLLHARQAMNAAVVRKTLLICGYTRGQRLCQTQSLDAQVSQKLMMVMMMTFVSGNEFSVGLANRHQEHAKQALHNASADKKAMKAEWLGRISL